MTSRMAFFSGYDAKARKYDQSKWGFEKGRRRSAA